MTLKNIYPICVALSEKNAERTIALGRKFPFVEVRLDSGEYSGESVKQVFKSLKTAIATCRPGRYDEAQRAELLCVALRSGAKFVDIEVESSPKFKKELLSLAKKKKARIILSYHNFETTPSKKNLNQIIVKAKRCGADLVKIATQVRDKRDANVLLALLAEHEKLIVVGMGEAGKAIRIATPLLGGLFTFASPEQGKETAPGQIDFKTLQGIYSSLRIVKAE